MNAVILRVFCLLFFLRSILCFFFVCMFVCACRNFKVDRYITSINSVLRNKFGSDLPEFFVFDTVFCKRFIFFFFWLDDVATLTCVCLYRGKGKRRYTLILFYFLYDWHGIQIDQMIVFSIHLLSNDRHSLEMGYLDEVWGTTIYTYICIA